MSRKAAIAVGFCSTISVAVVDWWNIAEKSICSNWTSGIATALIILFNLFS